MDKHLTKKFLDQQTKVLQEEKVKIAKQIEELKKDDPFNDPDHASDNAAVDTDVREQDYHAILEAQINQLQKRNSNIDLSVQKIAKGSYGYCEKCNDPIPEARLQLVPEARYCVKCESKLRK